MKAELLLKLVERRGQIVTLDTQRPVKVKKGMPNIIKRTTFQARVGVNYDNMAAVKEKRETGSLPEKNQGLADALEWVKFPVILKNTNTGKEFLRVSKLNSANTPKVQFYINDQEIDPETVKTMAYASEFSHKESPDVYNIDIDNIIDVRGV